MKKIQNNKHKHVLFQLGTQGMAKLSLAIFYSQKISTRWVTKLASSLHIQRFFIFGNSNSTSKPVSIESDLVQSGSSQRVVSTYVEARTGLTKPNMNDKPAVSVSETQSRLVVEKGLDKGHQNDSTSRARALSRFGVFLFVAVMQHSVGSTSRARALSQLCAAFQLPSSSTSRARALSLMGAGIRSLLGSTSRARALSLEGVDTAFEGSTGSPLDSTSRARALSLEGVFHMVRRIDSTSRARALSLFGVIILAAASSVVMLLPASEQVAAQTSSQLNFQGRLLTNTGSLVPDGTYNVEFNLYYVDTGGTAQWTEDRLNINGEGVTIQNGYFSVYLGEYDAFPALDWSQDLYLGMTIRGTASCAWGACTPTDSEMTPRFKLTSVPYAFVSSNVASSNTNASTTDSDDVSITTGDALGATSDSGDITIDVGTAAQNTGSILLGTNNASAVTIGNAAGSTTLQGPVSLTGTGTALTVTNNAQFNGNVTLGSDTADSLTVEANATFNGSLTVSTGDTFTNAGATLNTAVAVADIAAGGDIGTAGATVDSATTFNVNQTTVSQALTLPTPTDTTAGRVVYINNVGTASFTMYGTTIGVNGSNAFIWNGAQWITTVSLSGSSVSVVGTLDSQPKSADGAAIVGSAIYLQTADATSPGLVSNDAQTFAGAKSFNDSLSINATASSALTGTVDVDAGSATVAGSGTFFTTELEVGDRVTIDDTAETYTVFAIASDTSLTFSSNVTTNDDSSAATRLPAALTVFDSSNNLDFVINDQGFVGIGSDAPTEQLEVAGDVFIQGTGSTIAGSDLSNGSLRIGSTLAIDQNEIVFGTEAVIGTTPGSNADIIFNTNGSSRDLVIDSTGNIGIGTAGAVADPANLLSVNTLTTADADAEVAISTGGAGNVGLIVQGVVGQTENVLELQESTGGNLFSVSSTGNTIANGQFVSGAGIFRTSDTDVLATNTTNVILRSGNSITSGDTGAVNIQSGAATSGNSGNIVVDTGTASGTTGTISVGTTNASGVTLGSSTANLSIQGQGAATGTDIINLRVAGDTNDRFIVDADGTLNWGGGSSAADVSLFRQSASNLRTNGNFLIGTSAATGRFNVVANGANPAGVFTAAVSQTANILQTQANGGTVLSGFNAGGNLFYTNNGFTQTIASAVLSTGDATITIPDTAGVDDTICLATLGNCGSASDTVITVAASDTPAGVAAGADYTADGTSDEDEINTALTAAAGGTVILLEGTFVADGTILIPNNTTLEGQGPGTVIELADLDVDENLIENSDTTTGTGVVIRDLNLDGRDDLNTAGTQSGIYLDGVGDTSTSLTGSIIENVESTRFRNVGIYFNNVDLSTLKAVEAISNVTGIYLDNSNQNSVVNSIAYNNQTGITATNGSDRNTFTGNIVSANTGGSTGWGFSLNGSRDNVLSSNTIRNNSRGIRFFTADNNTITSNTLTDNSNAGIYFVSGSNENVISSNRIEDSGGATNNRAIYLSTSDGNSIIGNVITDTSCTTTCYAIDIINSTSENNYLADNTYSNSGSDPATINDAGTGTIYANQQTPSDILQSSSSLIRANASTALTGTAAVTAASPTVTGTGTFFTTELEEGDRITINGETYTVITITDDTTLTVNTGYVSSASGQTVTRLPLALKVTTSGGTSAITVNDAGFVGLGTDSPNYKLEVVGGSSGSETPLLQIRSNSASAGTASTLRFANTTGGSTPNGAAEISGIRVDGAGASELLFRTGTGSGSALDDQLRINSLGYIGIGSAVTSPANLLGVNTLTTADADAQVAISTGGTTNTGLIVQGVASQSANIFEVQDSTANPRFVVNADGGIATISTGSIGSTTFDNARQFYVQSNSSTRVGQVIRGAASQTADLLQLQSNGGTVLSGFNSNGSLFVGTTSNFANTRSSLFTNGASVIGLAIRGDASQTADLQQFQNNSGTVLSGFNAGGNLFVGTTTAPNRINVNNLTTADADAQVAISSGGTGNNALILQAVAGQTAELLEVQASDGTVNFSVEANGNVNIVNSGTTELLFQGDGNTTNLASQDSVQIRIDSNDNGTETFEVLNGSNAVLFGLDESAVASLGNSTLQGSLALNDGNGFVATLDTDTLTGSATISIPDTAGVDDTICLQVLGNCGDLGSDEIITVAASDTPAAQAAAADYNAPGTEDSAGAGIGTLDGDQITINTALAANAGGTVTLLEGTYTIDGPIQIPNNTTLEGSGPGTVIQLGNFGGTSTDINAIENSDTSTGEGVVIRNLTLDGRTDQNSAGTQRGIIFDNVGTSTRDGGEITGVTIERFTDNGIRLEDSSGNIVSQNIISNVLIGINNSGTSPQSTANSITNNTISESNTGISITDGARHSVVGNTILEGQTAVFLQSTDNNVVSSNTMFSQSIYGVRFLNSAVDNIVSNNNILSPGGAATNNAVHIDGSDNNTIIGNIIEDDSCTTDCHAINITDATSENNYLADNTYRSTGADPATINDAGTGTIYANQQTPSSILQNSSTLILANASTTLTGTADPDGTTTLNGTLSSTRFTTELEVGDRITINAETRRVTSITDDDTLTVDIAFSNTADAAITRLPQALNVTDSAGSSSLFVSDNGNVGIGTATPRVKLQVSGGSEASLTTGTGYFVLGSVGSTNLVFDEDEIQARNNGAASDLLLQPAGGNVGIGTDAPSDFLEIEGALGANGLTIDSSDGAGINVDRGANTNYFGINFLTAGVESWSIGNKSKANEKLQFYAGGSTTSSLTIDTNGYLGLGTGNNNPGNILSVNTLTTADADAQVAISTGGTGNKGIVVQEVAGQTATPFEIQDSTGTALTYFNTTNDRWYTTGLSNITSFGQSRIDLSTGTFIRTSNDVNVALTVQNDSATATANLLNLSDDGGVIAGFNIAGNLFYTNNGFTSVLDSATFTGNQTITLPDATGTVVLNTSGSAISGVSAFVQGGNSWGTTAVLGTNDNQALEFETNGFTGLTIDTSQNATFSADVAVNGGDITTNQTTFDLLNTTATTVNAFGAATSVSIGASSGTTTVNNDTTISGLLTVTNGSSNLPVLNPDIDLLIDDTDSTSSNAILALISGNNSGAFSQIFFGDSDEEDAGRIVYSQEDDTFSFRTNGAADSLTINSAGAASFQNASNSTTAFRVQTAGSTSLLNVDTTNELVTVKGTVFDAATTQAFTGSGNITQSNIDGFGTILISSDAAGYTATLQDPTNTAAGRLVYVTNTGSFDMTLAANGGGTLQEVTLKPNTSATMVWNGSDWTAAGASSSTDLQAAYNNTATSAGGAELILNAPGGAADGLTIRNNDVTPISGGLLEVQASIGNNLFSVNNFGTEFSANGGAETDSGFSTDWTALSGTTVTRETVTADVATGQASVEVSAASDVNDGVANNLATPLAANTTYLVSFTGKLDSGDAFTTLEVWYTPDGGGTTIQCTNYSTQTLITADWSKVTCDLETDGTFVSNSDLYIRQSDNPTVDRVFHIDNLSIRENESTSTPPNVQIGGGQLGGAVTLFTLDQAASPPVASGDSTYFGSMYYDTTTGRIQCYEADGWGACGSPPNNIVTLTPEYAGAVLNGTGVGTMTADFCSDQSGILQINNTLCSTGQANNYYEWTSPQATSQTYSILLTFQLPQTFDGFIDDNTITLDGRTTDTTDANVTYEVFRSTGATITECGSDTTVTTSNNTWQTVQHNGNEATDTTNCNFAAGDKVIFKLNMTARNNDSVYVSDINFTYTND